MAPLPERLAPDGAAAQAAERSTQAIFTTDDIGMQTGPMFSPAVFREFFKPRYKRMIDAAHEHGMHFWLHTCGDIRLFMDDLIEIGLDVIHPIQKLSSGTQNRPLRGS